MRDAMMRPENRSQEENLMERQTMNILGSLRINDILCSNVLFFLLFCKERIEEYLKKTVTIKFHLTEDFSSVKWQSLWDVLVFNITCVKCIASVTLAFRSFKQRFLTMESRPHTRE